MNYTFYFWDNLIAITGVIVSGLVAILIYLLSKQLSARDKYAHEKIITEQIHEIGIYKSVILADVKKYKPFRKDYSNQTYYKQGAELYTCIPEYGVQVILLPNSEAIPVGLIPFSWIEIVRDCDSEDNKPIIVCKFKGIKWFKQFKSPFKEVNYVYENPAYQEGIDPESLRYTSSKPVTTK
jgi:hypothetical protein